MMLTMTMTMRKRRKSSGKERMMRMMRMMKMMKMILSLDPPSTHVACYEQWK